MKLIKKLLVVASVGVAASAFAIGNPVTQLQTMANQVIAQVKVKKSQFKKNPEVLADIMKKYIIPHVDVRRMTGSMVGRNDWMKASKSQQNQLVNQITLMVAHTYAAAFASYNDDVIRFLPVRGGYQKSQTLEIRSVLIRKTGQRVPIFYNVVNNGNKWQIYDISIENVGMVSSYRSQFAPTLQQSGVAGLIKKLKAHNEKHG